MNGRNGTVDGDVKTIRDVLVKGLRTFGIKATDVTVKRRNSVSKRVRVISDVFLDKASRERAQIVLPVLRQLPKEFDQDITMVLCLTPDEAEESPVKKEFESPSEPVEVI